MRRFGTKNDNGYESKIMRPQDSNCNGFGKGYSLFNTFGEHWEELIEITSSKPSKLRNNRFRCKDKEVSIMKYSNMDKGV